MSNPWQNINLEDYENHMKLDSVMQLQSMNEMMNEQFYTYPVKTIMILGIAGGNGLNHIRPGKIEKVYGVDINENYLERCVHRYPELEGIFESVLCDLQAENADLPEAEFCLLNMWGMKISKEVLRKRRPNMYQRSSRLTGKKDLFQILLIFMSLTIWMKFIAKLTGKG